MKLRCEDGREGILAAKLAWMKNTGGRHKQRVHVLTTVTADVDIRVRVRGGGHTSQIYAIRQAIAKSIVSCSAASNHVLVTSLVLACTHEPQFEV